jgi:hypothetical protein
MDKVTRRSFVTTIGAATVVPAAAIDALKNKYLKNLGRLESA